MAQDIIQAIENDWVSFPGGELAGSGLTDAQRELLQRFGIHDIYRASVKACVRDLGLDHAASDRLFGDKFGTAA